MFVWLNNKSSFRTYTNLYRHNLIACRWLILETKISKFTRPTDTVKACEAKKPSWTKQQDKNNGVDRDSNATNCRDADVNSSWVDSFPQRRGNLGRLGSQGIWEGDNHRDSLRLLLLHSIGPLWWKIATVPLPSLQQGKLLRWDHSSHCSVQYAVWHIIKEFKAPMGWLKSSK